MSAPGRSRTCDPRLRRPMLYPAELQAQSCSIIWSGWRDSNPRHPAPKAGALPGCATPRYQVSRQMSILLHKTHILPSWNINRRRILLYQRLHHNDQERFNDIYYCQHKIHRLWLVHVKMGAIQKSTSG